MMMTSCVSMFGLAVTLFVCAHKSRVFILMSLSEA